MLTVKLYGDLGARYGRVFRLDVASPAEAIHALCSQLRGLRQYFIAHGTQKFLVRGHQDYDETDLSYPQSTGTLKVVPIVQGTGAWGKIIAGAALAVVGFFIPVVGAAVTSMGLALAMGGISQLLAPRQQGKATPEKAHNQPMNLTVEGSSTLSPLDLGMPRSKGIVIGFWTVTALFCLQIGFTAYAQMVLPQVAEEFTHLGFPDYFRVELTWA